MRKLWRWLVKWFRTPTPPPSADTRRARARLDDVYRDDARVERLTSAVDRVQRQNNLGPAISRALRERRP